jgi:hypothetical protein
MLRVMREAPIPGGYNLIYLLVYMMNLYKHAYSVGQFGRVVQRGQRVGQRLTCAVHAKGCNENELVERAVGKKSCQTCGDKR